MSTVSFVVAILMWHCEEIRLQLELMTTQQDIVTSLDGVLIHM